MITFNHARAINNLGIDFAYTEFFIEYAKLFRDKFDTKLFVDLANDDIKGEANRFTTGVDLDVLLKKRKSLNLEFEYQTFQRSELRATNMLLSLAFNKGSKFTGALLTEFSTDETVIETGKGNKIWVGANVKYKPNFRNNFLLFAGTRRGGPACTAGVCYEILNFEGVELRYTRRL
jgi:hypothetical protein